VNAASKATSMMRWASADASAPDTTEIGDRHSTTLSKLAKSGEVTKAERGYRLPEAGGTSATS
jgi:hypothetical protein